METAARAVPDHLVHLEHRNGWDIYFNKPQHAFHARFSAEGRWTSVSFDRASLAAVYSEIDRRPPFTLKAPMLVAVETFGAWQLAECVGMYSHRYGQGVRLRTLWEGETPTRRSDGSVLRVDSQADVDALNALVRAEKDARTAWDAAAKAVRAKRNELRLPYHAEELTKLQQQQARRIRDRARRAAR